MAPSPAPASLWQLRQLAANTAWPRRACALACVSTASAGQRCAGEATALSEISTLHKTSLVVSGVAGLVVSALMFSTHAGVAEAVLFGLYGAGASLRAFGRSLANVHARLVRVAGSDFVYAVLLVAGLVGLIVLGRLTMLNAAFVLVLATPHFASFVVDVPV